MSKLVAITGLGNQGSALLQAGIKESDAVVDKHPAPGENGLNAGQVLTVLTEASPDVFYVPVFSSYSRFLADKITASASPRADGSTDVSSLVDFLSFDSEMKRQGYGFTPIYQLRMFLNGAIASSRVPSYDRKEFIWVALGRDTAGVREHQPSPAAL